MTRRQGLQSSLRITGQGEGTMQKSSNDEWTSDESRLVDFGFKRRKMENVGYGVAGEI
jgi:hypothetical protein